MRPLLVLALCFSAAACYRLYPKDDPRMDPGYKGDFPSVSESLVKQQASIDFQSEQRLVEQGRKLFFDPSLSGNGKVSCASCHHPDKAFTDGEPTPTGGVGRVARNTPSLLNAGLYGPPYAWDGSSATLEAFVKRPIEHPQEMNGKASPEVVVALAAYLKTLHSAPTAFDTRRLSEAAKRGEVVFNGVANCTNCHKGTLFTDRALHRTGAGKSDDQGAKGPDGERSFRTSSLRMISQTAPYMHDGSLATLESVVDFYTEKAEGPAFVPRAKLSKQQKADLVEFLKAL